MRLKSLKIVQHIKQCIVPWYGKLSDGIACHHWPSLHSQEPWPHSQYRQQKQRRQCLEVPKSGCRQLACSRIPQRHHGTRHVASEHDDTECCMHKGKQFPRLSMEMRPLVRWSHKYPAQALSSKDHHGNMQHCSLPRIRTKCSSSHGGRGPARLVTTAAVQCAHAGITEQGKQASFKKR